MESRIPTLETERLTLRGHRLADFEDSAAMWADPVVVRHTLGRPQAGDEVWARLLRYVGHWELLGFGFWVVRERHGGKFVGEVGFGDMHRSLGPDFDPSPEGGWVLATAAHGKGYATEAMKAAHAWLEGSGRAGRTVCLINEQNVASIRVAQKLGYREFRRATYKDSPGILFERVGR